ncbi:benenodin family lasso peptide [Phenylobacterium montanum]|uniref:Benenodin family lasso peptide n=1 Tax=Phenylobacterium montanum TaxID=2823693 RepID=A0A975G4Z0_9CAUL|nr:benenodin family lasso peptide [Caulobacter sp. S6]QUD90131.1 benenodin family lasso peptide [Caulobacter sp. S6]
MDRIIETNDQDLVDLGAASVETRGGPLGVGEGEGRQHIEGLADD